MNKLNNYMQIFSKLTLLWLFIAIWWGFTLLSPLQIHNQIIKSDLIYLGGAFFIFLSLFIIIIIKFNKTGNNILSQKNIYFLFPSFFLLIFAAINIYYIRDTTFSFLLLTAALFLITYSIGFYPLKEISYLLCLSAAGPVFTRAIMNSLRGKPHMGAKFFCPQVSHLINIFGGNSSTISETLFFNNKKITCDLIKLGFYPWLAFIVGFSVLIIASEGKLKKRIITLIVSFVLHYLYLLFRFAALCIIMPNTFIAGNHPFNFLYWRLPLISFSPLIPLWCLIIINSKITDFSHVFKIYPIQIQKKELLGGLILFLLGMSFIIYHSFPGFINKQKKVHIIIDEIHSRWESSLVDFDENIRGILAENSYHCLLDYLRHFYKLTVLTNIASHKITSLPEGVEIIKDSILSSQLFEKIKNRSPEYTSVLILKCITTPFFEIEIEAIRDFVSKGGCLFLIGDHTDVFFMNKNLNELSRHFGISYQQNSVYFVDGGWVISEPRHYNAHPVTAYLDKFIWATGNSLKLSPPAYPLIYSSFVCFADHVNYFFDNFFGNTKLDTEEIFGSYCIMAGAEYGKGKVVAFTDSTCFNNYLMFTVGRRELIAGINTWFGTKSIINPFPWLALLLIFFLIIYVIEKKIKAHNLFYLLLLFFSFGSIIGFIIASTLNSLIYPPPEPILPLTPKVVIDSSHDPAHCMSFGNSESFLSNTSYDNLVFNIGRTNLFAEIIYKDKLSKDILAGSGCLVIASPRKAYSVKEKKAIQDFVIDGGSVLLIEGAKPNSTINQIANLFDINFRLYPHRDKVSEMKKNISPSHGIKFINPVWIDGGETLFAFHGMSVISFIKKGKGLIVAIGDDTIFMKNNATSYLVNFQCNLIKALVYNNEALLKTIDWNYLKWK